MRNNTINGLITVLLCLSISALSIAQTENNWEEKYIYTSSSINYNAPIESYSFYKTYLSEQTSLVLSYLTETSGTFNIEDPESIEVNSEIRSIFPSQIFSVGASFQIRNAKSYYHEFSLARLSTSKSEYYEFYTFSNDEESVTIGRFGYRQNSSIFSVRYEYGKYFGDKKSKFRFGLAGSFEPSLYSYNRRPSAVIRYPVTARILKFDVAIIPIFSFRIGKKISIDFKFIPNILLADFGQTKLNDPSIFPNEQGGVRAYSLPEISLASSIQIRYLLKEPDSKSRRR